MLVKQFERDIYALDQRINDRGIGVDLGFVHNAIEFANRKSETLVEQARELTGLSNPNSVAQLKNWLEGNDVLADSLNKKALVELIKATDDARIEDVLRIRQQLGKSSVSKYTAMTRAVCWDGRVRGLVQYYGASRTGRWCLAEGSLIKVKTLDGAVCEKQIQDVLLTDLVWDGDNWVQHEGVVFSGDKDVITWDGVTATPEHNVWVDANTKMPLGEAKEKQLPLWRGNDVRDL